MQAARQWIGRRDGLLAVVDGTIGLTLGYLDSRPSWDDTRITAALLLLSSAMAAGLRSAAMALGAADRDLDPELRGLGACRPRLARGARGLDPGGFWWLSVG